MPAAYAKCASSRRPERLERNGGMAEPWMAEIKEHTLSETARSLTAIRDDRRQMRAAEADLIRQVRCQAFFFITLKSRVV